MRRSGWLVPVEKLKTVTAFGGVAATVLALTGCTGGQDQAKPSADTSITQSAASPAGSPTSGRAEHAHGKTVTKAPTLPTGAVVAQAANARGSREMEVRGGIKPGTLSVLVNCQGKGTLTVSVEPVGLSFPLECVDGQVSSILNEFTSKRTSEHGTVSVTAPARVRWALTVGR
jgi:hypothetical protein